MSELEMLAVGYVAFVSLIALEGAVSLWRGDGRYRLGEAVVNVGHGMTFQVWDSFTKALVFLPFLAVSGAVTWTVLPSDAVWGWVIGLLLYDFCSYWAHRHHHEFHFLWAIHSAHHAAEDFNLAAALRQATFQSLFKWAWKLPLALVLPLEMMIGLVVFDYLYQFLQHTQYVPKLGPIEWVMNTPSHHRVHHGTEDKYLDKNYGGILIIWDRLFGTFQVEEEAPTYGLTQQLRSLNPVWGNLAIWADLVRATGRAEGWDKLRLWVAGPADLARLAPGEAPRVLPPPVENGDVPLPRAIYVAGSMLSAIPALAVMLLAGEAWGLGARLAVGVFVVLTPLCMGALLERKEWALVVEPLRLLGGALIGGFAMGPLAAVPALAWLLVHAAIWHLPRASGAPLATR